MDIWEWKLELFWDKITTSKGKKVNKIDVLFVCVYFLTKENYFLLQLTKNQKLRKHVFWERKNDREREKERER